MSKYTFISAEVTGDRPFLMMAYDVYKQLNAKPTSKRDKMATPTPREMAKEYLYLEAETKKLWFPSAAVFRLLREAGSSLKLKGERKSVKYKVPAAVLMMDDALYFRRPNSEEFLCDPEWEVHIGSVVNAKVGARIPLCRPRIDAWSLRMRMRINPEVLSDDIIHKLLQDGGEQIGLGSYRPEKGGNFGLFRVTSWQQEKM